MMAPNSSTLKGNLKSLVATGGVLAGTGTASQAAIVYTDISDLTVSAGSELYFSLTAQAADTTGAVDFQFWLNFPGPQEDPLFHGVGAAAVAGYFAPYSLANRLNSGNAISGSFLAYGYLARAGAGQWDPGDQGYLGLSFDNSGTINYGWADMSYNADQSVTLYGFAYDDTGGAINAGQIAPVPEPAVTGAFAAVLAGSVAAFEARRRRKVARQVQSEPITV